MEFCKQVNVMVTTADKPSLSIHDNIPINESGGKHDWYKFLHTYKNFTVSIFLIKNGKLKPNRKATDHENQTNNEFMKGLIITTDAYKIMWGAAFKISILPLYDVCIVFLTLAKESNFEVCLLSFDLKGIKFFYWSILFNCFFSIHINNP